MINHPNRFSTSLEARRAGLPEVILNQAGYATGVFDQATLGSDASHSYSYSYSYKVQAYDLRRAPSFREKNHVIEAQSAEHAIHLVSKRSSFVFTRKDQGSLNEGERDNAHYQVDPSHGFVGFISLRA